MWANIDLMPILICDLYVMMFFSLGVFFSLGQGNHRFYFETKNINMFRVAIFSKRKNRSRSKFEEKKHIQRSVCTLQGKQRDRETYLNWVKGWICDGQSQNWLLSIIFWNVKIYQIRLSDVICFGVKTKTCHFTEPAMLRNRTFCIAACTLLW